MSVLLPHETMTARQRVQRAIRRESVDRYPIDLGAHPSTGISAFAYFNLLNYLGLPCDDINMFDLVQGLATVDETVRQRLHVDVVAVEPRWQNPNVWQPRGHYAFKVPQDYKPQLNNDGDWIVTKDDLSMRMPNGGYFFDGDWLSSGWHNLDDDELLKMLADEAERLYKETDYALMYNGYASWGIGGTFFTDIEQGMRMITDPEEVHADNQRLLESSIQRFDRMNTSFGQYVDLISIGNDMGTQNGPLCRPAHIEEFCMPYYTAFCGHVHNNSDIKVFLHCCGSIRPLIGMIADAGIDILNPVQISADNMDPDDLKQEFGERIHFWGGACDTQNVLGKCSVEELKTHVRKTANIFKEHGGFTFTQVHNIMGDVPPEHVLALFDTAYEESFYE